MENGSKRRQGPFFSISWKLNLLIIGIILLVSAGLLAIFYHIYCDTVDDRYYEKLILAADSVDSVLYGPIVEDLRNAVFSEEYQAVREAAIKARDPDVIRNWLETHYGEARAVSAAEDADVPSEPAAERYSLAEERDYVNTVLEAVKEEYGLDSVYLQVDIDGVTWNLADPNEDIFYAGSKEDPIPEFEDFEDDEGVPPTYYETKDGWCCAYLIPFENEMNGKFLCLIGTEFRLTDVIRARHAFFFQSSVFILVLIGVSILAATILSRHMITKPLQQLSDAAGSFAGGEKGYTKDSVISLDIRSKDEIGDLYRDIRSMEERIVDYTDHLTRITAEREHVETELRTAYGIQMSMLPSVFPDLREYDLCASMSPAKEVGGDFYDFFLIDDDHLALVIADVSGKGVPAALFMMYAKILLSYRARMGGSPSEIIWNVNEEICRDNPSEMFVTVWLGILEISTGRLCCCNAGHEYPFLRQGGKFSLMKDRHSLAVGMRSNIRYREYEIQLQPGDAIFVYTDGVPEAQNAQEEFYGLKRTEETLNQCTSDTAEAVLQAIRDDNARFVGDAMQFDDLTMLCLIYRGTEKA